MKVLSQKTKTYSRLITLITIVSFPVVAVIVEGVVVGVLVGVLLVLTKLVKTKFVATVLVLPAVSTKDQLQ